MIINLLSYSFLQLSPSNFSIVLPKPTLIYFRIVLYCLKASAFMSTGITICNGDGVGQISTPDFRIFYCISEQFTQII